MAAYILEREGEQASIRLAGDLTAVLVPDLQTDLKQILNEGASKLVFDLSETEMLDSSGIGLLIAALNSATQRSGEVRVVNVAPEIFRLLQHMRLTSRLNVSPRAA